MAKDDFYFAFEAKYRGARELIKNRQKVYIPFIDHLKSVYKKMQHKNSYLYLMICFPENMD